MADSAYDALLVVSFGGPEGREDVLPFLDNVLRGKRVPEARKLEVAEHYYHFDGVSPHNRQMRELIEALRPELEAHGIDLPLYWGNRNWHPLLTDALRQMADDGVQRALAFFVSAYSSYSGCRQYRENIAEARAQVGAHAPEVDKIRVFFNHPGFVQANADHLELALSELPAAERDAANVLFTAHSLPSAMAAGCDYERQLQEACRLVAEACGVERYRLVYQSRSGPPQQPWLEPDVCDAIESLHKEGVKSLAIAPIGFVSDHMEVLYDLDTEARELCERIGMNMTRAATCGTHPAYIAMIRELIEERISGAEKRSLGPLGPWHDVCPENCCLPTTPM